MLKVTIPLTVLSGSVWTLPDNLHKDYLELKAYEKQKANALRSFRPVPALPAKLKAVQDKILSLMPAGSPKGLVVDALKDKISKIGPTGNPVAGGLAIALNPRLK